MGMAIMNVFRANDVAAPSRTMATSRVSRAEEKKDMVAMSTKAKDYQTVKKALSSTPEVRIEKVNDIRSRMEANMYNVNAQMLAEKIMGGLTAL